MSTSEGGVRRRKRARTNSSLRRSASRPLLEVENVPDHLHEKHIFTGYRAGFSFYDCLRSLFKLHNETGNVWTHLIGGVVFLGLVFYTSYYIMEPEKIQMVDKVKVAMQEVTELQIMFGSKLMELHNEGVHSLTNMTFQDLIQYTSQRANETIIRPLIQGNISWVDGEWLELALNHLSSLKEMIVETGVDRLNRTHMKNYLQFVGNELKSIQGWKPFQKLPETQATLSMLTILDNLKESFTLHPSAVSRWPIYFFLFSVTICLSCSAAFHLFLCHYDTRTYKNVAKLDYSGVAFMIAGSMVPIVAYLFYNSDLFFNLYLAVTLVLGTGMVCVATVDFFGTPQWRNVRAGVFVAMAAFGIVPAIHKAILLGFDHELIKVLFSWGSLVCLAYLLGVMFFTSRIPESIFPGKFDIFCHSHQLWHICVVVAAGIHYKLVLYLYNNALSI